MKQAIVFFVSLVIFGCDNIDVKLIDKCQQNVETAQEQAKFIRECVKGGTNHSLSKHYNDAKENTEYIVNSCREASESVFRICKEEYKWCERNIPPGYECAHAEDWMPCSKAISKPIRLACKKAGFKYDD